MTLEELISSGIVKDEDKITISKTLVGSGYDVRKRNWFNDQVLEFAKSELEDLAWDRERGFSILLKDGAPLWKKGGRILRSFKLKDGRESSIRAVGTRGRETYFMFDRIYWFFPMNLDYLKGGDWETSDMQKFLNTDVLEDLPDELVRVIAPRKIGNWEGKLWLFSYEEVFGAEQIKIFREENGRIMLDDKGNPRSWWLRSEKSPSYFSAVYSAGSSIYLSANDSYGVCPGFIIRR